MADYFLKHDFTDQDKRNWVIRFTGLEMVKIREKLNVNICDARADPQLFAHSLTAEQVFETVWIAIEKDAIQRQVTRESFLASIYGDTFDELSDAFWGALTNFSQPAKLRAEAGNLLDRAKRIADQEVEKSLERARAISDDELRKAMGFTTNSSNSPVLSGSITESSPTES